MAQNEEIKVNINFDTNANDATADVNQLGDAINDATKATEDLDKAQDKLGTSMKSSGKAVLENGGAMGLLNDLTGGYANMVKDAIEALDIFKKSKQADTLATEATTVATGNLTIAQRALNLVAKANPYLLLATAIAAISAALYGWFSVSQKQKEILEDSTDAINLNALSTENLKDTIERAKTETESSNNVEIARARALGASEKEIQKMIQAQKDLAATTSIVNSAKAYQQLLEAQNNLATLRAKIGTGGFFGLSDAEEEALKAGQEAVKQATDFYTQQQGLVDTVINDATANRFNVIAENNKKELDEQQKQSDKKKTQAEKDAEAEKKRVEGIANDAIAFQKIINDAELQERLRANQEILDADAAFYKENEIREDKTASDSIERAKAAAIAKKTIQEAEINALMGAVGIAASLLSKTKDQQKAGLIAENALGIAKTVINTSAANAATTLKYALVPGGIALAAGEIAANNINAGISIAASVAATAKGLIAIGAGGSPTSGTTPSSAGASAVAQPNVAFQASSGNQIAGAIASTKQGKDVIKAYVVASEVSTQQSLDANKIEGTSI